MPQRVNVLCIRSTEGRVSQLSGNERDIRRIFGNALPGFAREEGSTSFLARFIAPARDEFFITNYEGVGDVRKFAQDNKLELWLDPQCDFEGNLIPESGVKGDPTKVANYILTL